MISRCIYLRHKHAKEARLRKVGVITGRLSLLAFDIADLSNVTECAWHKSVRIPHSQLHILIGSKHW